MPAARSEIPVASRVAGASPDELLLLDRVLEVVRERKGLDFRGYRASTMMRRVRNRMIAANVRAFPAYLEKLSADPGEADALVGKLTIKVSRFFRDAATFDALRRALAERLAERRPAPLAVWSAGCGHGEEPYSLAMLLAELGWPPERADVLATDVDEAALQLACEARYPPAALGPVGEPLRARHFAELRGPKGSVFAARPELRRWVRFEQHDLAGAGAPAAGRFDLVLCRNVLIYLQVALQERVERLLARALLPGGLLCLGEAEWLLPSVGRSFEVVDRKARLFRLREAAPFEATP